ncbi:titin-like isoform X3 [Anthonomus grandis grandis]|nr:titin-like isoform X3 [Anthonomus grandis grandis]XP_050303178.1 titin-like isoform X3 [Anthonomus grandis grandis]
MYGYLRLLRPNKVCLQYELEEGTHTIGTTNSCNIYLKQINQKDSVLDIYAVVKVQKNGVATIQAQNYSTSVTLNNKKVTLRPQILLHGAKFNVLGKEFQYVNDRFKDLLEDDEIFVTAKYNILRENPHRKSVNLLGSIKKTPTFKTKVKSPPKTTTPLNRSLLQFYRGHSQRQSQDHNKSASYSRDSKQISRKIQEKGNTNKRKQDTSEHEEETGESLEETKQLVAVRTSSRYSKHYQSIVVHATKDQSDAETSEAEAHQAQRKSSSIRRSKAPLEQDLQQLSDNEQINNQRSVSYKSPRNTSSRKSLKASREDSDDRDIENYQAYVTSRSQRTSEAHKEQDNHDSSEEEENGAHQTNISFRSQRNISLRKSKAQSRNDDISDNTDIENYQAYIASGSQRASEAHKDQENHDSSEEENGAHQTNISFRPQRNISLRKSKVQSRNDDISDNTDIENYQAYVALGSQSTSEAHKEQDNHESSEEENEAHQTHISSRAQRNTSLRRSRKAQREEADHEISYDDAITNNPTNISVKSQRKSASRRNIRVQQEEESSDFLEYKEKLDISEAEVKSRTFRTSSLRKSRNVTREIENHDSSQDESHLNQKDDFETKVNARRRSEGNTSVSRSVNALEEGPRKSRSSFRQSTQNDTIKDGVFDGENQSVNPSPVIKNTTLRKSRSSYRQSQTNVQEINTSLKERSYSKSANTTLRTSLRTYDDSTREVEAFQSVGNMVMNNTFNESTQDARMTPQDVIILDDTVDVLSPVQPVTERKSYRNSRTDSSRRSASKLNDSSLTNTRMSQSTTSVVSVSSQSFSSFQKGESRSDSSKKLNDESSALEGRRKSSINNTPKQDSRSGQLTPEMFEAFTSTPFPKSVKKSLGSTKKSMLKVTTQTSIVQTEVIVSSMEVTSDFSRIRSPSVIEIDNSTVRRSRRASTTKNGHHNCISCGGGESLRLNKSLSDLKDLSLTVDQKTENLSRSANVSSSIRNKSAKATAKESAELSEIETPKSHVKPARRSSMANHSAYNPVFEDITPVTPMQVSGFTETFKTPINTPGLFENIRKSAIRSRKRLRESTGSVLKVAKKARTDGPQDADNSASTTNEESSSPAKRQQKSPLNRLSNFEGVKKLMKTPPKSPKNDLRNIPNLRRIMAPKPQNSPKNDLSEPLGVKKLFKTLKQQKPPENDLTNISGVENIFNVSGMDVLHQGSDIENSEDLFTKITGKKPVRSYTSRGKSLSPSKNDEVQAHRKTMGDIPLCSPRVQQWVEEHSNYAEKHTVTEQNCSNMSEILDSTPSPVKPARKSQRMRQNMASGSQDSLLENVSEEPNKKARTGRSVSPQKEANQQNRRYTQGDVLNRKSKPEKSSYSEESVEELIENVPEKRVTRVGRSLSAKKPARNDQRRITQAYNLQFNEKVDDSSNRSKHLKDDVNNSRMSENLANVSQDSLLVNVSEGPNKMARIGRSVSPRKEANQQNRRYTQGDVLSRKSKPQKSSHDEESFEDLIENMPEKGVKRVGRSLSAKKPSRNDQRRVTQAYNLQFNEEDVDDSPNRSKHFKDDVNNSRMSENLANISQDSLLVNVSEGPNKMARIGRSVSPRKETNQQNRRYTQGDVLNRKFKPEKSIYGEESFDDLIENMPEKRVKRVGRSLSAKKPPRNDQRRVTQAYNLQFTEEVDNSPNRSKHFKDDVNNSRMSQNLANSSQDSLLENVSEGPNKKARIGRSVSPRKEANQQNRRYTQGDVLNRKSKPQKSTYDEDSVEELIENMPEKGVERVGRSLSAKKTSRNDQRRVTQAYNLQFTNEEVEDSPNKSKNITIKGELNKSRSRSISPQKSARKSSLKRTSSIRRELEVDILKKSIKSRDSQEWTSESYSLGEMSQEHPNKKPKLNLSLKSKNLNESIDLFDDYFNDNQDQLEETAKKGVSFSPKKKSSIKPDHSKSQEVDIPLEKQPRIASPQVKRSVRVARKVAPKEETKPKVEAPKTRRGRRGQKERDPTPEIEAVTREKRNKEGPPSEQITVKETVDIPTRPRRGRAKQVVEETIIESTPVEILVRPRRGKAVQETTPDVPIVRKSKRGKAQIVRETPEPEEVRDTEDPSEATPEVIKKPTTGGKATRGKTAKQEIAEKPDKVVSTRPRRGQRIIELVDEEPSEVDVAKNGSKKGGKVAKVVEPNEKPQETEAVRPRRGRAAPKKEAIQVPAEEQEVVNKPLATVKRGRRRVESQTDVENLQDNIEEVTKPRAAKTVRFENIDAGTDTSKPVRGGKRKNVDFVIVEEPIKEQIVKKSTRGKSKKNAEPIVEPNEETKQKNATEAEPHEVKPTRGRSTRRNEKVEVQSIATRGKSRRK